MDPYFTFTVQVTDGNFEWESVEMSDQERTALTILSRAALETYEKGSSHPLDTTTTTSFINSSSSLDQSPLVVPSSSTSSSQDSFVTTPVADHAATTTSSPQGSGYSVNTKYKPKGIKVEPVDAPLPDEFRTQFVVPKYSRDPYASPLTARPPKFVATERLNEENVAQMVGPPGWLTPDEQDLLLHAAALRERAIAFEVHQLGQRKLSYGPATIIPTVHHQPWQDKPWPLPHALRPQVTELIRDQIKQGLMEPSQAPYSSRWFVIMKKSGKIRFIFDAQKMNSITIRDAGVPPSIRDYVDDMQGRQCAGAIDLLLGYLQEPLDERSRDLTTFRTPIGLYRLTRLPVGATNSVAVFQRLITTVLRDEIPDVCQPFIDDIGIRGPASDYDDERLADNPNIRRWVFEHAVNVERILFRLEEAGLTASGPKLVLAAPEVTIVGTTVSKEGKRAQESQVEKILSWPTPKTAFELRGFYGLFNFLRLYAPGCAEAESVIRRRLRGRRNEPIDWDDEAQVAFDTLKAQLAKRLVLKPIDYSSGRLVIVSVDSSNIAVGVAIWQLNEQGERQPVLFDSIGFLAVETRYSQPKLELRGVHKVLIKYKYMLAGIRFVLECDAISLRQTLNTPDLPTATLTRWVAAIKEFDFDFVHVPANEHVVADSLSRRPLAEGEEPELLDPESSYDVLPARLATDEPDLDTQIGNRIEESEWIHLTPFFKNVSRYLLDPTAHLEVTGKQRVAILREVPKYYVRDGHLFKRYRGQGVEVTFSPARQRDALRLVHEEFGHRGRDAAYSKLVGRLFWPGMKRSVHEWIKSCPQCQLHTERREMEAHSPTLTSRLFQKIALDVVNMSARAGRFKYLIVARDDLSGWVEARALTNIRAENVADFLFQDVICRFGTPGFYLTDNGSEFAGAFALLTQKYQVQLLHSAPFNPQANGMVERGHATLVKSIVNATPVDKPQSWAEHLHPALWADRLTEKRTTRRTPYEMVYASKPALPIDNAFDTWIGLGWKKEMTTEELLDLRLKQLERAPELREQAAEAMAKARLDSVRYLDSKEAHKVRPALDVGDLVLVRHSAIDKQWGTRFDVRWFGPYVVSKRGSQGNYKLRTLDGIERENKYGAAQLRRFYPRPAREQEIFVDEEEHPEPEPEVPAPEVPQLRLTRARRRALEEGLGGGDFSTGEEQ